MDPCDMLARVDFDSSRDLIHEYYFTVIIIFLA